MATCPECGGRLWPGHLAANLFRGEIPCRWCRARLAFPKPLRLAKDALVVTAGVAGVTICGARFWSTADPLWALGALGSAGAALALGSVIEAVLPLRTVVPRDYRRWSRQERVGLERTADR